MSKNVSFSEKKKTTLDGGGHRKRGRDWFDDDITPDSDKDCAQSPPTSLVSKLHTVGGGNTSRSSMGVSGKTSSSYIGHTVNRSLLPKRLFAKDQIPSGGHINCYSKIDYLISLRKLLGTQEMECIMDSQFRTLFGIEVKQTGFSGKLVHQFLCRSLMKKKKHELWFVFGCNPLRFSIKEFAFITGLNCNYYPEDDPLSSSQDVSQVRSSWWKKLIGERDQCLVADIVEMLRVDSEKAVNYRMKPERRLRLALLVLVEGILLPTTWGGTTTVPVVEMVKDIDSFLEYPWAENPLSSH